MLGRKGINKDTVKTNPSNISSSSNNSATFARLRKGRVADMSSILMSCTQQVEP